MRLILAIAATILLSPAINVHAQDSVTNSIGMKFVRINPGSMVVGRFQPTVPAPGGGLGGGPGLGDAVYKKAADMAKQDATPGFNISISQPYYMQQFEVTQEQWKKIMGNNPSYFQGDKVKDNAALHPVENVSWNDAQAFIKKLNTLEKGKVVYRLPTEFEWEYAARAGAQDDISWANINATAVIAQTHTFMAGTKKPNAWGLYDMLGNVWEWVQDYYNEKIFADPMPPHTGAVHVLKGSSFTGDVKNATYLAHAGGPADGWNVGFRVVMEVPGSVNETAPKIPEGFTPLFNGKDLTGWHISRSTHQGTTPNFSVEDGAIVGRENPYGQGGLLMTDKIYKNFELYAEVKIDSFANGGLFLRSSESGVAYQIELVLPGGIGAFIGERINVSKAARATGIEKVWKANEWNAFRVRITGDAPHVTLWVNGVQLYDVTEPKNDLIAGETSGHIALQCHWTALYSDAAGVGMGLTSWQPGAAHRFRNIGVKEIE